MTHPWSCWAVLLLLCLAGCAGAPRPGVEPGNWNDHRARLDALTRFTTQGKIALRTPEQAESASLLWQQVGEATHLRLTGPMGLSATTVDSDGRQLEIRQGEDRSQWSLDDPAVTGSAAGHLPLRALPHWLKGVPAPGLPLEDLTLDENSQLAVQLQQQGWTVEYQSYETFQSYRLPTRLTLFSDETSARIILRNWQDLGH